MICVLHILVTHLAHHQLHVCRGALARLGPFSIVRRTREQTQHRLTRRNWWCAIRIYGKYKYRTWMNLCLLYTKKKPNTARFYMYYTKIKYWKKMLQGWLSGLMFAAVAAAMNLSSRKKKWFYITYLAAHIIWHIYPCQFYIGCVSFKVLPITVIIISTFIGKGAAAAAATLNQVV